MLNFTSFGRYVLAIGGNEEAARLMGLPVDRVKFWTYVQSGVFASLAGVILAAQFGAGQPAEGRRMGAVLDRRGRRRGNAADGRRRLGRHDA